VRATHAEMIELGHIFASRLNLAKGPVVVAVPTQGLSIPNVPGGVFWDPPADAAFLATVRAELRGDIPVTTLRGTSTTPSLGVAVAELFLELMSPSAGAPA
jgi:uncharacterized protein (UPF0261 family)